MDDLKRLDKLEKDIMFIANIRDVLQEVSRFDIPERDVEAKSQDCVTSKICEGIGDHQTALEDERKRRREVEDSAKLVGIQLQKTEDELARLREVKRVLLMGTLELKNQMQGYESQIANSRSEIDRLKVQQKALQKSEEQTAEEKRRLERDKESHLQEIQLLQKKLSQLEYHRAKWESLGKGSLQKDTCIKETEERLQEVMAINEALLKDKRINEGELRNLQIKMDEKRIANEKEKAARLVQEKERLEAESSKASRIVLRVKEVLLKVQQDKNKTKEAFEQSRRKLKVERDSWRRKERELQSRIKSLEKQLTQKDATVEHRVRAKEEDRQVLETIVKRLEVEKASLEKRIGCIDDFTSRQLRDKDDELVRERQEVARLKGELERVKDNIGILQKVSEDQVKTIRKQRDELEELKEEELRREREASCRERELKLLVDEEATERRRFKGIAGRLEEQLLSLQADVESHNCEDEVDVTWRSRVERLEKEIASLEKERDSAVEGARKAVDGAKELKRRCEGKCETMKTAFLEKIAQVEKEKTEAAGETTKKVGELETEVRRLTKLGEQMQETYGAKVAHLQGILQACLNGGGQVLLGAAGQVAFGKDQLNFINSLNGTRGTFQNATLGIPQNFNGGMAFP